MLEKQIFENIEKEIVYNLMYAFVCCCFAKKNEL